MATADEEAEFATDTETADDEEAAAAATTSLEDSEGPKFVVVRARATFSSAWIRHKTLTFDSINNYAHLHREPLRGTYGGRLDREPQEATGFFYVKRIGDRWSFVDPEGRLFICAGLNSVAPLNNMRGYRETFANEYGDTKTWAERTSDFIFNQTGFNTIGCWSDPKTYNDNGIYTPYCPNWNFMSTFAGSRASLYKDGVIPVFQPEFETHCDERARQLVATANDPWLLGHFSDNELPLKSINILQNYLKLPETDPGHQAALQWLTERNKTAARITAVDNAEFCTVVISRYYRIVSTAIKKYDPNHLYIGSRIHGRVVAQDCTFIAAGPWVDVISINYYHRWTPEQANMNRWAELSGRPIMPTEWYAKGDDSGITAPNGAGYSVATQQDRGAFYQNFALGLLRNPNAVGWHWFKYIDSTGTNAGLYDVNMHSWQQLAESMKAINSRLYSLSDYMSTAPEQFFIDKDEVVPE